MVTVAVQPQLKATRDPCAATRFAWASLGVPSGNSCVMEPPVKKARKDCVSSSDNSSRFPAPTSLPKMTNICKGYIPGTQIRPQRGP